MQTTKDHQILKIRSNKLKFNRHRVRAPPQWIVTTLIRLPHKYSQQQQILWVAHNNKFRRHSNFNSQLARMLQMYLRQMYRKVSLMQMFRHLKCE